MKYEDFFNGKTEMNAMCRTFDWSSTPVGIYLLGLI